MLVPLRAENETRTRDPDLGKVVLYQLSYFRKKSLIFCAIFGGASEKRVFHSACTKIPQYVKDVLVERDCKDTAKIRISKKN